MDPRARALEALYRERYSAFRNMVATITGSYESAHDVVQDAFADALRHRDGFRGDGSLAAWVWRIALREAWRWRSAQAQNRPLEDGAANVPALVEPERDPVLAEALLRLSPRRRLAVFLRYFGDLSYEEIAEALSVSSGTVAAMLAQAREALLADLTTVEVKS